jgi:hypothetical protein
MEERWIWLKIEASDGLFEHGYEPSGSIIYEGFLD